VLIQIIANVAISIGCFMPKASEEMLNQLGIKKKLSDFDIDIAKKWMIVAPGTTINKAEPLFPRIKKKNV
jgi:methionyl-tRNA synthetase